MTRLQASRHVSRHLAPEPWWRWCIWAGLMLAAFAAFAGCSDVDAAMERKNLLHVLAGACILAIGFGLRDLFGRRPADPQVAPESHLVVVYDQRCFEGHRAVMVACHQCNLAEVDCWATGQIGAPTIRYAAVLKAFGRLVKKNGLITHELPQYESEPGFRREERPS